MHPRRIRYWLALLALVLLIPWAPAVALAAPQIALFPSDREKLVIEHRFGAATPLRASVPVIAQEAEAKNLTFALKDDPVDEATGRRIPAGSVTVTPPAAGLEPGRLANVTIVFTEIPGPGLYPVPLYVQADGMAAPQPLKVELKVLQPPELLVADQTAQFKPNGVYEIPFRLLPRDIGLTGITFSVKDPVPSAENGAVILQPSQATVVRENGDPAPTALRPTADPLPLRLQLKQPGPGTYRIPLTMSADGLSAPITQPFTVVIPAVKMDALPNGYTLRYVSPWSYSGPGLATWISDRVSALFGTGSGGPCDRQLITFRTHPSSATAKTPVEFNAFVDGRRGRVLAEAKPVLKPVAPTDCTGEVREITFQGESQRQFLIDLRTEKAGAPARPGTYTGQLYIGSGPAREPVQVTIEVRHGVGVAIIASLLGLLAHWLLNVFRKRRAQEPHFRRLMQLQWKLQGGNPPVLVNKLAGWVAEDLRNMADTVLIEKQLTLAQTLLDLPKYTLWAQKLDEVDANNQPVWNSLRDCIKAMAPNTSVEKLHPEIQKTVDQCKTGLVIPAPGDIAVVDGSLSAAGLDKIIHSWFSFLIAFVRRLYNATNTWVFPGTMTWMLKVVRVGVFLAAIGATIIATVTTYQARPDFGANLLADYGTAFGVGFLGKEFNNFLQAQVKGQ